uniref:TBC domain-containing protein kinase-like protein n=1 Tax=Lygus hesperus TaxID=30085 RepID=A0A0A9Z2A2_LYGHE
MSHLKDYCHQFCCMTFIAKQRGLELCGSNGLPLTPNSIKILGRSRYLIRLNHKNLCTYIDVLRGKHERTVIVCERVGMPLSMHTFRDWVGPVLFARDVLEALAYLHQHGVIHRCLSRENIFLVNNVWKLFNFGLYYMTGNGADVLFPITAPKYAAPEVILSGPDDKSSTPSDIWSMGIILAEVLLGCDVFSKMDLKSTLKKIISLVTESNVFHAIAKQCGKLALYERFPVELKELVNYMLKVDPDERLTAQDLLSLEIFRLVDAEVENSKNFRFTRTKANLNHDAMIELYHYWQLSGGDVFSELKKKGLIHNKPPILSLPSLLMLEGMQFGGSKDESQCLESSIILLNITHLLGRIQKLPGVCRYPYLKSRAYKSEECESSSLPLVIKERDSEYQFKRIQVFKHLLPAKLNMKLITEEAGQDIPPLIRAEVWSFILNVQPDYQSQYDLIDKESPAPTDRQIEVDIPRCHQYNEILSSHVGHQKFKRILKAWVKSHPHYVYWQGLDSLCAPFLFLNFHEEARAYASVTKFIDKYLHNFFLKDNSAVIQEYLAKLKHLIAFLDPVLACHLLCIGFSPELFAIPWFLTMFSHVLPIHKILHLWDSLLLCDSSHPLFIGYSILQQFRSTLLSSGFNECILLFSDLPDIDIEKCVQDSRHFYKETPRSITYRKHDLNEDENIFLFGMDSLAIPLKCLQDEVSPRISVKELSHLVMIPATRSKILIVDIRDQVLYKKQSLVGSINMPLIEKIDSKSDHSKLNLPLLMTHQGKIIVVAGDDMQTVSSVCRLLVSSGFPKVCSLNGNVSSPASSELLR